MAGWGSAVSLEAFGLLHGFGEVHGMTGLGLMANNGKHLLSV